MPLTLQERTNVRRHLKYPLQGLQSVSPSGGSLSTVNNAYRFFESYGQLEYRMSQLAPDEESRITGKAYGALGFNNNGIVVSVGSTLTITLTSTAFSASPVILTYVIQPTDNLLTICGGIAQQAALNNVFTSAGFYAINDFGNGPFAQQVVPFPQVSLIAPNNHTAFTIAVSTNGDTLPQITADGSLLSPSIFLDTTIPPIAIHGFLPILDTLESYMGSSIQNLSVHKAREFTRNPREVTEKKHLYKTWCYRLAEFMGLSFDINNNARFSGSNRGSLIC